MNSKIGILVAVTCWIVMSVFCASAVRAQQDTLAWNFAAGDRFDVTLVQSSEIQSFLTLNSLEDQNKTGRTASNRLTMSMEWTVDSVAANGDATLNQKITRIEVTGDNGARTGDRTITVDTGAETKPPGISGSLQKQMKSLVGLSFLVTMSTRGEVVDVAIPENTLEALRQIPGSMQIRQMMDPVALKNLYGQAATVLPETAIAAGDSWTATADLETAMGSFIRTNKYTLDGIDESDGSSLANFSIETTMQSAAAGDNEGNVDETANEENGAGADADPLAAEQTGPTRLVEFSGSGTMVMDVGAGYFVSSKTGNVLKSEKDYFDNTIVTQVKSDIEMTIVKSK